MLYVRCGHDKYKVLGENNQNCDGFYIQITLQVIYQSSLNWNTSKDTLWVVFRQRQLKSLIRKEVLKLNKMFKLC